MDSIQPGPAPSAEPYEQITYAVADRVATITLNRPAARNGYTLRMSEELVDAFDRADVDDDVRVVVLAGAGDHFCAGLDLAPEEIAAIAANAPEGEGDEWSEPAGACTMRMFTMNKPVIAAVQGAAVGAGATIVLAADYRLVASDARFGFVFSRRGIYAEAASTWFLPRIVGLGVALDWLITGRAFDAREAMASGLAHSVHEPDQLLPKAYRLAGAIAAKTAPVSVAVIRRMVYRMSALESPAPAHRLDSRLMADSLQSPDATEGFDAFLHRRDPHFPGRIGKDLPHYLPWTAASEEGSSQPQEQSPSP
ncbi:enoyl-CoA hydratase-related protein [Yinghuangia seranimata]|uniref:enoyl-CoA hydratase-related protein n=1 Tax=Yinghuangia seranimata TaxID=408067 RepID=UPI00248C12D3|nr:enoyl-CoA hydratase-related protein [Yinghuangia seranimata]MDI2132304.1 enoyl-CoA hydratase-related protein [Yinghuangia seranimata]